MTGMNPVSGLAQFVFICYLLCFCSVLCLLCFCTCLLICALWSPAGKGLTPWLSFVVSNCEFVTFPLVSLVRCGALLYRVLIFTYFYKSLYLPENQSKLAYKLILHENFPEVNIFDTSPIPPSGELKIA